MSSVARKLLQVQPSAAEAASDDDFANVALLLDGDGTSGDDNNTFTDSGSLGGTVTATGDVVQGSFTPYGNNWSVYFDGSNDRLDVGAANATNIGSGDFTVEFWINSTDTSCNLLNPVSSTGTGYWGLMIQSGDLRWNSAYNVTNKWVVDGAPILDGDWHHVAVVRNSGTFSVYYDGVSQSVQSGSFSDTTNYSGSDGVRIGEGNLNDFKGYLSNVRIVSGTAIYTSAFDPPTEPFSPTEYTSKILVCRSNRFIDDSSKIYYKTITPSGTPRVTRFSPFKDDDTRDITVDGGSANFNANELLTIADNSALDVDGAMTAEAWIYVNDFPDGNVGATGQGFVITRWVASGNQRSWGIFLGNNGQVSFYISESGGATYITASSATGAIKQYAWHHIAVVWDGAKIRLMIDGDQKATANSTSGPNSTPNAPFCANALNTTLTGSNMDMYIADARYFPDKAIYSKDLEVPRSPLGTLTGSAYTLNYVEYENKSFSVNSQDSNPQAFRFKSDGTKMFVVGATGDDINEYDLTTAWDVSTASYSQNFSVSSQDTTPNGIAFSADGTKMYISGNATDSVYQYNLSTAWDLSTASYSNNSLDASSEDLNVVDVFIHPSGTSLYIVGLTNDYIYQYDMTTAYDLSTASYASKSAYVKEETGSPTGLTFSSDGTKMLVCESTDESVHQYSLSTAWDVSTASYDNLLFAMNIQSVNPQGVEFKDDGTKLYLISNTGDAVYQYSLTSTATPTVLLNFQDAGIYDRTGINNIHTEGDVQVSTTYKKYGTGSMEFAGSDDYLLLDSVPLDFTEASDYTLEFWMYRTTNNTDALIDINSASLQIYVGSTGAISYFNGSTRITTTELVSSSTWAHVAVVKNNNVVRIYVDGVNSGGTYTDGTNYTGAFAVGARTTGATEFAGYIDDLRITKNIARYTADFTPPTAALPKF